MLATLFVSTLIGAPVGVRIATTDDWEVASLVADGLERAIDARLDRGAIRLPNDVRCKDDPNRCAEQSRVDFGADDIVLIRVFGGVTKHLVIIERFSPEREPQKLTLSLPSSGVGWDEQLGAMVAELLPEEKELRVATQPAVEAPTSEPLGWWGPVMIIAGAAAIGTAAVLAERAEHTRTQLFEGTSSPDEFARLDRMRGRYGVSSFVMLGIGGVLAGGGLLVVVLDW